VVSRKSSFTHPDGLYVFWTYPKLIVAAFEAPAGFVDALDAQVTVTVAVVVALGASVSFTATPVTAYVRYVGAVALREVRSVIVLNFALILPLFLITTWYEEVAPGYASPTLNVADVVVKEGVTWSVAPTCPVAVIEVILTSQLPVAVPVPFIVSVVENVA
jgi:hypothetical protein